MAATKTNNAIPLNFQIITVVATCAIIAFMTLNFMDRFCSIDQLPQLKKLDEKNLISSKKKPQEVNVSLSVNDFSEFDVKLNKFILSGIIWFSFDPEKVSEEAIDKFSFEKGEILEKSKAKSFVSEGKKTTGYNIRVSFKSNLYNGYFPFQDHKIYLVLQDDEVTIDDMIFKSSSENLAVDKNIYMSGWQYWGKKVYEGYGTTKLVDADKIKEVNNPKIIFEFDYFNYSPRLVALIFLPLLLAFLLELFSLCMDQRELQSILLYLSRGDIAALFAYRFVIEAISPKVAYLTIADYLFFLFLSIPLLTFLIHGIGPYWTVFQKKIISLALQAYVLISIYFMFHFWTVCS